MVGVPCLTRWPAGPLLADVLAERALAQERDERAGRRAPSGTWRARPRRARGSQTRPRRAARAGRARALEQHAVARQQHAREQPAGLADVGAQCHSQPVGAPSRRPRRAPRRRSRRRRRGRAQARRPRRASAARRAELGHVAEHRDRARPAGPLDEGRERALAPTRVGVVGVVDEHAAARAARAPARAGARARSRPRPRATLRAAGPARTYGRGRGGEVRGVMRPRAAARPARRARRARRAPRACRPRRLPGEAAHVRRPARRTWSCAGPPRR